MIEQLNEEEAARERHRQRIEQMRRSKQRQLLFRSYFKKFAPLAAGGIAVCLLLLAGSRLLHKPSGNMQESAGKAASGTVDENTNDTINDITNENKGGSAEGIRDDSHKVGVNAGPEEEQAPLGEGAGSQTSGAVEKEEEISPVGKVIQTLKGEDRQKVYTAEVTADTQPIWDKLQSGEEFYSEYAVLVDLDSNNILAQKYARDRINPASMTKVLTILVAAENVKNLNDTFTMTLEITDYGYINDCSSAGFEKDEKVSILDLFYGTVLPSGADAALALAVYVAGDQETFVEMMNRKVEELGLSGSTHFTNCVGIYDENHYSTVYDMAMIMEAAIANDFCKKVMTAHTYTTSATLQHPDGIELSNWFLRRIEDKDTGGEVICGKTGYVEQSGSCAASYAVDDSGKGYVCVTAKANSPFRCISDHAKLYKQFAQE